jgi:hypothetical protein
MEICILDLNKHGVETVNQWLPTEASYISQGVLRLAIIDIGMALAL